MRCEIWLPWDLKKIFKNCALDKLRGSGWEIIDYIGFC